MCGIAGILDTNGQIGPRVLPGMADALAHRGPDDSGTFLSEDGRVGLAHRRLSFLDISSAGRQPMLTPDGALAVTFNGEIYNYRELRAELESLGHRFVSQTDTEVLLLGYRAWGMQLPGRLHGMFAFALYDRDARKLVLVRDRFGIKPLFYGRFGSRFVFGSELKALFAAGGIPKNIRRASVSGFLANRYVPTPHTLWQDILKVPPAHSLTVDIDTLQTTLTRYWELPVDKAADRSLPVHDTIDRKLRESLAEHLRSDVPVGSFLSGGMDSSLMVLLMKESGYTPLHTFSIGFTGWDDSEHRFAQAVSDALGAKQHTLLLDELSMDTVSRLMYHYDDPIADISILPTYAVSGLAAQTVKAVVSGEGSDECFGGYWWQQPGNFYFPARRQRLWARIRGKRFSDIKAHYIQAMSMGLFDAAELREAFTPGWQDAVPEDPFAHFDRYRKEGLGTLKQIQYLDLHTFMSELILTKVDRASMAHSLEVRVPFLDHRLVEYVFSLPERAYFDASVQKMHLRKLLEGKVPPVIYERKKQGFVGPDVFYKATEVYRSALWNGRLVQDGVIRRGYIAGLLEKEEHWKLWKLFVLENWWKIWV